MKEGYQIEQGDAERHHRNLNLLIDKKHPSVYEFLSLSAGLFATAYQTVIEVHAEGDLSRRDQNKEKRKQKVLDVVEQLSDDSDMIANLKSVVLIANADIPLKRVPKMLCKRVKRSSPSDQPETSQQVPTDSSFGSLSELDPVPPNVQLLDDLSGDSNDFIYERFNLPNTAISDEEFVVERLDSDDHDDSDWENNYENLMDFNAQIFDSESDLVALSSIEQCPFPPDSGKKATKAKARRNVIEVPVDVVEKLAKPVKKKISESTTKVPKIVTKQDVLKENHEIEAIRPRIMRAARLRANDTQAKKSQKVVNAVTTVPKRSYTKRKNK